MFTHTALAWNVTGPQGPMGPAPSTAVGGPAGGSYWTTTWTESAVAPRVTISKSMRVPAGTYLVVLSADLSVLDMRGAPLTNWLAGPAPTVCTMKMGTMTKSASLAVWPGSLTPWGETAFYTTSGPGEIELSCTAEKSRGYLQPDGTFSGPVDARLAVDALVYATPAELR